MGFCFVIQPFDSPNDKRYEDVFKPAIEEAGLDAYRLDRDPGATVLIEEIEDRIKSCDACLADITTDNPNVWYELGYALAAGKVVVLVAAEGRDRFPFDIQHRRVIKYKAEAPRDFATLREQVVAQLRGALKRRVDLAQVSQALAAPQAGLNSQQLSALVAIAQSQNDASGISAYQVRVEMSSVGFTDIATTIALRGLTRMGFIEAYIDNDRNEDFTAYRARDAGLDWLEENQDKLWLRRDEQPIDVARTSVVSPDDTELDDLPF